MLAADNVLRLAAVGDLMLTGEWVDVFHGDETPVGLREIRALLIEHDLLLANLETASTSPHGCIPKQPRVIALPAVMERCLRLFRVDLANLANNHTFDSYVDGFERTQRLLQRLGIHHFGAGQNLEQARRPCILECKGIRIGWLGYADPTTRPSHVAGPCKFGINPLIEESALSDVSSLARFVDHVIVSLHWGVEFCHVPSPGQIRFARGLIDGGATLVIGHHAHVIQGVERYEAGAIAYNLGNLTTSDFTIDGRLAIRQTRRTRSSVILSACFTKTALRDVTVVPVRSEGSCILVNDDVARRMLKGANQRLAAGVSETSWRVRRLYEDVLLRTVWKLDPRVIRSVRPRHVAKALRNLSLALQGEGPA